jgi:dihydrofolate reductase
MKKPIVSIIAAIDENGGLGKNNQLLFKIPADLEHFKEITSGHPVIMGRKTFDSIGQPLLDRTNIIVTRIQDYQVNGCLVAHSIEEAIEMAHKEDSQEVFVIGGGQIYEQAIDLADKLYLTIVEGEHEADTFFPDYSEFKKVISEEKHESDGYKYRFLELER